MNLPPQKPMLRVARVLALAGAAAALGWTFRDVSVSHVLDLCARVGAGGLGLVLLPQALSFAVDTWGWMRVARWLRYRVRYSSLLFVRVATESLALCLPAGVVFAESAKIPMLMRHSGVQGAQAVALVSARKYLTLTAQGVYSIVVSALAAHALGFRWASFPGPSSWALGVFAAACALLLLAFGTRSILVHANVTVRLGAAWDRVRQLPSVLHRRAPAHGTAVRVSACSRRARFENTDAELARLFTFSAGREAWLTMGFVFGWLGESVETYVGLRLLGVNLDFGAIAAMEVMLSLLRSLVVVLPAGIGVQDAGYALLLRALGVNDSVDTVAAFALLKRAKELLWVGVGLALLTRRPTIVTSTNGLSEPRFVLSTLRGDS
ncbi:MAG TPA: lysylphosphatidylglycerol synthase domain-containing protein [Polyangiaceae bacterium]|nr:lysylphosphatidylglycerol synthase domain-containing protein [Polyangiaceae bacterium]